MNKIGLLTYQYTTNFGSLLQAYGLYKTVKDFGYDCEVIDYHNETIDKREKPIRLRECTSLKPLFRYIVREGAKRKKERLFQQFLKEDMSLSEKPYTKHNIIDANSVYDTFLIGSDLVWDFSINNHDTTYMLDFATDEKKRIAYASSAGSVWNEKDEVITLLGKFQHIGAREKEIADTLSNWLDKKVDFVCDPTMLINSDEWKKLACKRLIKEPYVICYMFDEKKQIYKDAVTYGKKHNLPVYVISFSKAPEGIKTIRPSSVNEFLSLILNADTVFSASYHGMLFSMYFNKNFYYYNRGWKSRMKSIARLTNVENREHYTGENEEPINYDYVNAQLKTFREESVEKLKNYLKD